MAGGNVTSEGVTTGDLMLAGGTILETGTVGADLAAAGGTVTVLGPITGDARIGGGTVVLQSSIGGDLLVLGGQISIGGVGIKGDATILGGTIHIDAPIAKTLIVRGGKVFINAPITGNVDIDAETVTLGKNAVLSGDVSYSATKEFTKEDGAVVRGQVHFTPKAAAAPSTPHSNSILALSFVWILGTFLTLLVCSMIVGLLFKRYCLEVVSRASTQPLNEFGRGVITFIVLPIASVLLLISGIGIPFGLLGLIACAAFCIMTWIVSPIAIGSIVYGYFSKQAYDITWQTILLGVFVCLLLSVIPFVGWLIQVVVGAIVLGALVGIKLDIAKQWR
jgi:cytoskeletal protein CcmA (bactofilin family)